jgi:hypothetical protein
MKTRLLRIALTLPLVLLCCGCAGILPPTAAAISTEETGPASPSLPPSAEVTVTLLPPSGTPQDAGIELHILDMLSGSTHNEEVIEMTRQEDGRWQAQLPQPVGSLVGYRYVRSRPSSAQEASACGDQILQRMLYVSGPLQIDDIAAGWSDVPYSGPSGRIIGQVRDAISNAPLSEVLVRAGGLTSFTDAEGAFRIDCLAPGLHNLIVQHPQGAYLPAQQGAIIGADATTPAAISLQPAQEILLTLEVTLPSNTMPGAPLRVAGNIRQLGYSFSASTADLPSPAVDLPTMTMVDAMHYILLLKAYAGTDLRYRYTLGDALWNAELDPNGMPLTRQVILAGGEPILHDAVASWRSASAGSVLLYVSVPSITPPGDIISLQLNTSAGLPSIPMWRLSEREWLYAIYGPLSPSTTISYRYCRNMQCGCADDAQTAGASATSRQVTPSVDTQELHDVVTAWQWWEEAPAEATVVAPDPILPRADFQVGVELIPGLRYEWGDSLSNGLAEVADLGANAIILTPTWTWQRMAPLPILEFDHAAAPFEEDLSRAAALARQDGLLVALHPTTIARQQPMQDWWGETIRDAGWWSVWFEEYRSFILSMAEQASHIGASKLILGGADVSPAFPVGQLPGGSPSGVPADAEARWRALLGEVRQRFAGPLALELELGMGLQDVPSFIDAVDEVHIHWHAPLSQDAQASLPTMQSAAGIWLKEAILALPQLAGKPVSLSVEYLSLDGGANGCLQTEEGLCLPASVFDAGAPIQNGLTIDLTEQAAAINAVLLEAYAQPGVSGFYVRRFNPSATLLDASASVYGKPAQDVLWYWYARITGAHE